MKSEIKLKSIILGGIKTIGYKICILVSLFLNKLLCCETNSSNLDNLVPTTI